MLEKNWTVLSFPKHNDTVLIYILNISHNLL